MLSSNEKEFILSAVRQEQRVDGRRPFDCRRIHFAFGRDDGHVEVQLGQTRVMAVVSANLNPPYPDRPNEGSLSIFTEFSPMADPGFEPGRQGEAAVELGRIVDRGLRESRAVDMESLCIVPGKFVWALRVDCHVLDNGGNLVDAANLAVLTGLLTFRRPECSLGGEDGQQVTVHPPEERDPLPLSIHHLPIAVTFAFFNDGESVVVDPSLKEEAAMGGRLTITLNIHGEICAIQKGGGVEVSAGEVMRCIRIAKNKVQDMTAVMKADVEAYDKLRQDRKVKRHQPAFSSEGGKHREVVLRDSDFTHDQRTVEEGMNVDKVENVKKDDRDMAEEDVDMDRKENLEEAEDDDLESEEEESESEGDKNRTAEKSMFSGGASSWLDDDIRAKIPKAKKIFDPEAMDEFEKVAAMLSNPTKSLDQVSGSTAAAAVYANKNINSAMAQNSLGPVKAEEMEVESDEEGVTLQVTSEFSQQALNAKEIKAEPGESLAAAVKMKKGNKKRKSKKQ